jgi:peptidoglycan hydrolase-like protein with peptidoglycan-binding domain
MIKKHNYRVSKKIYHLSYNTTTIAVLFSVILILSAGGTGLPLLQQQQQAYASSQLQGPPSTPSSSQPLVPSSQLLPPLPRPPTPICDPQSPTTLQLGSTGAKVTELQRVLTQVGYGSLLVGQGGAIGGEFTTSTQNAVKKFQQDNRLPVDGKIGPISWRALCTLITSVAPSPSSAGICFFC